MEAVSHYLSLEQARNAAIAWLEARDVAFGPYRGICLGTLGVMKGSEVGVEASAGRCWRLRLDYDPMKGPHYNAEVGKKGSREKRAFIFPGDARMMAKIAQRRSPR